ncbi:hypothetical protein ACFOZY_02625 [Chungangia koreensis]|uniref:DUF7147 domain-containing protein n=1 Tax=Chungangia koreensis TaxID=752657 RepID=A0ABV8X1B2_9LACT
MIQRFIELGEGYGDVFELCELMQTNQSRIYRTFLFTTEINGKKMHSAALALKSVGDSKFMPIYLCREGIPESSKRVEIFIEASKKAGINPVQVEVKPSKTFAEKDLYFHYLTGVLRLNHLLPQMS